MFPIFESKEDMARYFGYVAMTPADHERLEKAWKLFVTRYKGDGCFGCVAEMLTATSGSKKATISNTGRVDCYFMFRYENGSIVPCSAERKTNAGRIATLETEYSKAEEMSGRFVIYSMDVCNANTSYLRRYCPPKILPRRLFVDTLYSLNAVKLTCKRGIPDGYSIQSGLKSLWLWMCEYPVEYDRNRVYSAADFESLT